MHETSSVADRPGWFSLSYTSCHRPFNLPGYHARRFPSIATQRRTFLFPPEMMYHVAGLAFVTLTPHRRPIILGRILEEPSGFRASTFRASSPLYPPPTAANSRLRISQMDRQL